MFDVIGTEPQWKTVYHRLVTMDIDHVITDQELQELLPDAPKSSITSAFHRAMKEMEDEHRRSFTRVRHVGYRMVKAMEHEDLARVQYKRSKRRMDSAYQKVRSADRSGLTREERRRLDDIEDHISRQREMIGRLNRRQDKAEQRIAANEKDHAQSSDRIDALFALLEKHGIVNDSDGTE